jgi:two-component system phosphate regulon sensor histidine kinase PhoR
LPIHGTEWAVALDGERIVEDALGEAAAGVAEFRTRFGLAVAAAWLVGLAVVGLVWQTERVAQQRSTFAASAAHELRTPLAGLRMYGEMLAEGLGDPARRGDYARRIASESERLGRVVSNVLGFARLESGLLNVHCQRGDLAASILECTRGQRETLEAAGVTVRLDLPADYPKAWFDRDALCEIVQNLIDNAEKYTRGCADRTITVSLERGGRRARIVVSDHGPGVPPEKVGRLFRPFERGAGKDAPAGLGLGLVLSRALARAMDGDLDHEPDPSGGSRFVVRLRI